MGPVGVGGHASPGFHIPGGAAAARLLYRVGRGNSERAAKAGWGRGKGGREGEERKGEGRGGGERGQGEGAGGRARAGSQFLL